MKPYLNYLLAIFLLVASLTSTSQEKYINYYNQIKSFDLSKLWKSTKLNIVDGDVETIDFPEPLGFIGNDYQRFYIHYTGVTRDSVNPYKYHVVGKTRVNNNICIFKGTITIVKAEINPDLYYGKYKQGDIVCDVILMEDSTHAGSGFIKGKLVTDWYLDKKHTINYDTLDSYADGFDNNQFEGVWTSYNTHQHKKCNWGDFRIPNCGDLDGGAGEFMALKKYRKNGWQNHEDRFNTDETISRKALKEENRKWWL